MTEPHKRLLLAGYPKSGNTWCGYILCHLLGARYVDLHRPQDPPTANRRVQKLVGWGEGGQDRPLFAKTHALPDRVDGLWDYDARALIVRDPRDAAVSAYFYYYYNLKQGTPDDPTLHPYRRDQEYRQFKRNLWTVMTEWPEHTRAWLQIDGIRVIRYEDLVADTVGTLVRFFDDLGWEMPVDRIEASAGHFTFDRLSEGREPGQADQSAFFRKGVIGDHRNHFGPLDRLITTLKVPRDLRRRFFADAGGT